MKFISQFESFKSYLYGTDMFFVSDILKYLDVDNNIVNYGENYTPKSKYKVNVIDFFKEILLGKRIIFTSVNKINSNPSIDGIVKDVDSYAYKDEFYIKVEIDDEWYLVIGDEAVFIYDYDADNKPLHKRVIREKRQDNYNL